MCEICWFQRADKVSKQLKETFKDLKEIKDTFGDFYSVFTQVSALSQCNKSRLVQKPFRNISNDEKQNAANKDVFALLKQEKESNEGSENMSGEFPDKIIFVHVISELSDEGTFWCSYWSKELIESNVEKISDELGWMEKDLTAKRVIDKSTKQVLYCYCADDNLYLRCFILKYQPPADTIVRFVDVGRIDIVSANLDFYFVPKENLKMFPIMNLFCSLFGENFCKMSEVAKWSFTGLTQGKLLFTRLLDETENNGFKCHRVEMKTMTNIPKDINKEMKTILEKHKVEEHPTIEINNESSFKTKSISSSITQEKNTIESSEVDINWVDKIPDVKRQNVPKRLPPVKGLFYNATKLIERSWRQIEIMNIDLILTSQANVVFYALPLARDLVFSSLETNYIEYQHDRFTKTIDLMESRVGKTSQYFFIVHRTRDMMHPEYIINGVGKVESLVRLTHITKVYISYYSLSSIGKKYVSFSNDKTFFRTFSMDMYDAKLLLKEFRTKLEKLSCHPTFPKYYPWCGIPPLMPFVKPVYPLPSNDVTNNSIQDDSLMINDTKIDESSVEVHRDDMKDDNGSLKGCIAYSSSAQDHMQIETLKAAEKQKWGSEPSILKILLPSELIHRSHSAIDIASTEECQGVQDDMDCSNTKNLKKKEITENRTSHFDSTVYWVDQIPKEQRRNVACTLPPFKNLFNHLGQFRCKTWDDIELMNIVDILSLSGEKCFYALYIFQDEILKSFSNKYLTIQRRDWFDSLKMTKEKLGLCEQYIFIYRRFKQQSSEVFGVARIDDVVLQSATKYLLYVTYYSLSRVAGKHDLIFKIGQPRNMLAPVFAIDLLQKYKNCLESGKCEPVFKDYYPWCGIPPLIENSESKTCKYQEIRNDATDQEHIQEKEICSKKVREIKYSTDSLNSFTDCSVLELDYEQVEIKQKEGLPSISESEFLNSKSTQYGTVSESNEHQITSKELDKVSGETTVRSDNNGEKIKRLMDAMSNENERSLVPAAIPPIKNLFTNEKKLVNRPWREVELANIEQLLHSNARLAFYGVPLNTFSIVSSFSSKSIQINLTGKFYHLVNCMRSRQNSWSQYLFILQKGTTGNYWYNVIGIANIRYMTRFASNEKLSVSYYCLSGIGEHEIHFVKDIQNTYAISLDHAKELVLKFKQHLTNGSSTPFFSTYYPWCDVPPLSYEIENTEKETKDTKEVDKEDWDLENVVEPSSVEINKTTVIAMNIEESGEKAKKMNKSEMLNVVLVKEKKKTDKVNVKVPYKAPSIGNTQSLPDGQVHFDRDCKSSIDDLYWVDQIPVHKRSSIPTVLPPLKNMFVSKHILSDKHWREIELMNIKELLNCKDKMLFYFLSAGMTQIQESFVTKNITFNTRYLHLEPEIKNCFGRYIQYVFITNAQNKSGKVLAIGKLESSSQNKDQKPCLYITYYCLSHNQGLKFKHRSDSIIPPSKAIKWLKDLKMALEDGETKPTCPGHYYPWFEIPPLMNIVEPNYGLHDTSNNRQSSANLGKAIEEQDTYVIKSQENWDESEFCSDKPVVTESNRGYIEQNDQYLEEEKMKYDSINHDLGAECYPIEDKSKLTHNVSSRDVCEESHNLPESTEDSQQLVQSMNQKKGRNPIEYLSSFKSVSLSDLWNPHKNNEASEVADILSQPDFTTDTFDSKTPDPQSALFCNPIEYPKLSDILRENVNGRKLMRAEELENEMCTSGSNDDVSERVETSAKLANVLCQSIHGSTEDEHSGSGAHAMTKKPSAVICSSESSRSLSDRRARKNVITPDVDIISIIDTIKKDSPEGSCLSDVSIDITSLLSSYTEDEEQIKDYELDCGGLSGDIDESKKGSLDFDLNDMQHLEKNTFSNSNHSEEHMQYFKVKEWLQQFSYEQRSLVPQVLPPLKNLFISRGILRAQKWHRIELMNINEILNATRDIALKFYALPMSVDQIKKSFQTDFIVFPNNVFSATFRCAESLLLTHTQYVFVIRRDKNVKTHTYEIYGIARIEGVSRESTETHLSVTYFSLSSIGKCNVNFSPRDVGIFSLDLPVAYSLVQKFKLSLECIKSKPLFGIYFPWCGTPPLVEDLNYQGNERTIDQTKKHSIKEINYNLTKNQSIIDRSNAVEVPLAVNLESSNSKNIRCGRKSKSPISYKSGETDITQGGYGKEMLNQILLDEKPSLPCDREDESKVVGFYDSTGNWYPDVDSAIVTFEARIKMMTECLERSPKNNVGKAEVGNLSVSDEIENSFEELKLNEDEIDVGINSQQQCGVDDEMDVEQGTLNTIINSIGQIFQEFPEEEFSKFLQ